MSNIEQIARQYIAGGLSVIPIRPDGKKAPTVSWKPYQERIASDNEIKEWFGNDSGCGIAIIAGIVSGNLEVIDIDDGETGKQYLKRLKGCRGNLITKLPIVMTPRGGFHIYYRCSRIEGNQKLAQEANVEGNPEVLIETRGEGGYVIAPGSPAACHPTNKQYQHGRGNLAEIPEITEDERDCLLSTAREYNKYVPKSHANIDTLPAVATTNNSDGGRPGDDFNKRTTWRQILEPHGWTLSGRKGDKEEWRRPGKTDEGMSATTNYGDSELLYMFSSNAAPFEPERSYSKFAADALLNHDGDYKKAARELAELGYGEPLTPGIENTEEEQWQDPILFGEISTPVIDSCFLTQWARDFIDALTASTQTPQGLAVIMALPVLAACIQKRFEVSPYGDTYTEPLSLWTLTALPPASRKTAVLDALRKPISEWERDELVRLNPQIERIEDERDIIEARILELKKLASKCHE